MASTGEGGLHAVVLCCTMPAPVLRVRVGTSCKSTACARCALARADAGVPSHRLQRHRACHRGHLSDNRGQALDCGQDACCCRSVGAALAQVPD
eukprot:11242269-Alexandrium_andersonii.AAC.1